MTLRLILTRACAVSGKSCKVYRNASVSEYVVRYCENGVHKPAADYFCCDRDDALGTAAAMVPFLPLKEPV